MPPEQETTVHMSPNIPAAAIRQPENSSVHAEPGGSSTGDVNPCLDNYGIPIQHSSLPASTTLSILHQFLRPVTLKVCIYKFPFIHNEIIIKKMKPYSA